MVYGASMPPLMQDLRYALRMRVRCPRIHARRRVPPGLDRAGAAGGPAHGRVTEGMTARVCIIRETVANVVPSNSPTVQEKQQKTRSTAHGVFFPVEPARAAGRRTAR